MKRLLSFILALSLLGSLSLPALAEGAGEFTACTVRDGCLLEAGHEGDCKLQADENEGIMLLEDDPEPAQRVLYASVNGTHYTELSATVGDPPLNVQLHYYATGESPLVLDNNAVIAVTDLNGNPSDGLTVTKQDVADSCYSISINSPAPYRLVCTLDGDVIGSILFNANAPDNGDEEQDQIPGGLRAKVQENGETVYRANINMDANTGPVYEIYLDGTLVEDPETPWIYDDAVLEIVNVGSAWKIISSVAGSHTIGHPDSDAYITVHVQAGLDISNPPGDLGDGLYFCWKDGNGRRWGNSLNVSGTFTATLVYVKNHESFLVTDGDRLSYSPENGLNRMFSDNGVLTIQDGSKAGQYFVNYTHTDGTASYVIVNYNGSSTPDLENPPVDPGIYLCWNQNGQMVWNNNTTFSGELGASLVLVEMVNGNKVGSLITDSAKLSVTPAEGLQYTLYSDGICKLKGIRGGTYTMRYTVDGSTYYEMTIRYNDGSVDLAEAPSDPGLYHVIFDNHYIFTRQKGVSMRNGSGQTYGALVLVKDGGEKVQLTDPDLKDMSAKPYLTVSPSDGMTLDYNANNKSWVMKANKADLYTITYADTDGKNYTATVTISNSGQLYASVDGGQNWTSNLHVTEDEPTEVEFAWKNGAGNYIKTLGTVNGSNDQIHITRDMNTGISTLVVDNPNVNANASYHYDDYNTYMMQVISHEAYRLALVAEGTQTPVYDYMGEVDSQIPVQILFGLPSYGLDPFDGELTVSDGLELEADNGAGAYKLKILEEGKHTIGFTHTCGEDCPEVCDIADKTFTITVDGVPKESGGGFFALTGNSSAPTFGSALIAGEVQTLRLCYGSFGKYTVLTAAQLKVQGDAVTISQNGDAIDVAFSKNGQALIQYVDGDDIIHNYVVKCYSGLAEMGMAHYSEQGHNTVNLNYNGRTVTVGPALRTEEEMWMWPGNSFNHSEEEDWDIHDEVVIGAMYAGEGNSVTEPLDAGFFSRISNMNMSLLYCRNLVTNPDGENNVQIGTPTTVSWKGRTLQMQKFQGTRGLYFESELMISFDVQLSDGKYRFYRPADLSYRAVPDDEISVDIEEADVLNTLLSNSYTLINYLEDNVDGFKYGGGNLTLVLPAVTYDKILVSQLILPGSSDVLGIFTIRGSDEGTTVPGIYSKGFLHCVENLNFVANENAKMTFGGETFTCGLLVNNTRTDFQPAFDLDTLMAYHPEFQGLTAEDAQAKFAEYAPSVSTSGNSYNLGNINNCTFSGFEYAMRTDKGGFVQGARGCTIRNCKYGVYINAGGVDTLHTDGRANTIWRDNQFIENLISVRITGLPKDLSPYYIRFIDNRFWRNGTDFAVTCPGRFYFYRNYYSGLYPFSGWGVSAAADTDAGTESARAANLSVGDDTVLVTNPCRSVPDSTENLWIFDTDSLQNTMILQSEADGLKVTSDAIVDLGETLDIPVLNDQEAYIGVWTIYEGGDAE